jgi:hypothetical protein
LILGDSGVEAKQLCCVVMIRGGLGHDEGQRAFERR